MRFLADENIPAPSVRRLRESGHDVQFVLETNPGLEDEDVIAESRALGRVLLTLDSDIGERIFYRGDPPPVAVLFLRGTESHPLAVSDMVERFLASAERPLTGTFVTIDDRRIRIRALPDKRRR